MEVFKPNFSNSAYYIWGGIIIFCIIVFVVAFGRPFIVDMGTIIGVCGLLIPILICSFPMLIYRTMCYELQEQGLILKCGPFKSNIPYEKIKRINKIADLGFSPVGSIRLSNYLLGPSYFSKYGEITAYATSYKNVLLIETDKKRYGITPKDEDRFIRLLNENLKKQKEVDKNVRIPNSSGINHSSKAQ